MSDPYPNPSSRWPYEFDEWPHHEQIGCVESRMTRLGLIKECLSFAGLDPDEYDLQDNKKLRKKELAAIYLVLEGSANVE